MSYSFAPGATKQSIRVMTRDANTGQPKPGITSATSQQAVFYVRDGAQETQITLIDLGSATAAWQAGGWFEVATGLYRLDLPDAALAAGVVNVTVTVSFNGALGDAVAIILVPPISPVGAGSSTLTVTVQNSSSLAALPNANLWISTDSAAANIVAGTVFTNAQGQVTFYLNPGNYFAWVSLPGYNSANPYPVTVTSSATGLVIGLIAAAVPVAPTAVLTHTPQQTVFDVQGRLLDYLGADASAQAQRDCRRAIDDTLREMAHVHQWNYYYVRGRIQINGPFADGSVQYYQSSGTYLRELVYTPSVPGFNGSGSITGATNASPIVITSAAHGLLTGNLVTIAGVTGNTAANGTWTITVVDVNNFALTSQQNPLLLGPGPNTGPSIGNGNYTGGGTWTTKAPAWPTWIAIGGTVRINNVVSDVVTQVDGVTVLLDPVNNFGVDLPAGTSYTAYQDTYTLPEDFCSMDRTYAQISWGGMQYVHPNKWVEITRYIQTASNTPGYYTFTGDPRNPGRLALRIFPYPDQTSTMDMLYSRAPRKVQTWDYHTGTVSVSGGSPATVTGVGTTWTAKMVGSVLRVSADAINYPDATDGDNPYVEERTIIAVASATSLTVDQPFTNTYAAVLHRVADPIDVELGAMFAAFCRGCEKFLATQRKMKDKPDAEKLWQIAVMQAKEQDARNYAGGRVCGITPHYRQRLANMPIDFTGGTA